MSKRMIIDAVLVSRVGELSIVGISFPGPPVIEQLRQTERTFFSIPLEASAFNPRLSVARFKRISSWSEKDFLLYEEVSR